MEIKKFIEIWQQAATIEEVVSKTGLKKGNCKNKASYYRKRGVALKPLSRPFKNDWEELKRFAASFLPTIEKRGW